METPQDKRTSLDPVSEIIHVAGNQDQKNPFYYPASAQAEAQDAFLKNEESKALEKLKEINHADPEKQHLTAQRWQGSYVWMQAPRGTGRTRVLEKRVRETADSHPGEQLLLVTPYNRQAEQWRLWAQENKIPLETHVPESFAHSIVSTFYRELGYERPPDWATAKMKRIVRNIWDEMQAQMNQLIERMDERRELRVGQHVLAVAQMDRKATNAIQYAGTIQNEFFARVTRLFKDEAAINTDLANYMIKALLESRADLRNMLSRKYTALFLEEPETMDREFFDWFPLIKFQNIFATSIYTLKSKRGLYPWLETHWSNPDGRETNPNAAFFGVPVRSWRETYIRTLTRGRYQDTLRLTADENNTAVQIHFNEALAHRIKTEGLWPKARVVHLTLEPETKELRAGLWAAQNVLKFYTIKTSHLRHLHAEENKQPKKKKENFQEPTNLQVFFALPQVTHSEHPDIELWRDYFTSAFPALQELNLDVRYLALSDGPVEMPPVERRVEEFNNTIWIGTPLALNGCEFDLVLLPSLEDEKWPKAESTAWDWLDLCVSKARFATLALARKDQLIPPLKTRLPVAVQNERLSLPKQAKLYFEPLYRPQTLTNLFGPLV